MSMLMLDPKGPHRGGGEDSSGGLLSTRLLTKGAAELIMDKCQWQVCGKCDRNGTRVCLGV